MHENKQSGCQSKEQSLGKILRAEKHATAEAEKIEERAEQSKSIFDKEPMVKIPQRDFDKLIKRYKTAGALEKLYKESQDKVSALQSAVGRLTSEIGSLNTKIHQLTSFIKGRGLLEAFMEFISSKPRSFKTELDKAQKESVKLDKNKREVMSEKKIRRDQAR